MKTKILDCTIRDGGYLNNWGFTEQLVSDLYGAVSKSGTDYVEIGFRSSEKYVDLKNTGIWRVTPEETIEKIVRNNSGSKISLMVDFAKFDLTDIPQSQESMVDLYRLAVHKNKIIDAVPLINQIADKGYEVALNLMGVTRYTDKDFQLITDPIKDSNLEYLYFADSYGSLLPHEVEKYIDLLSETEKKLGFHPHNNMQLGLANTLQAINLGIDIVDGTVAGMGRGAGNMQLETLIAYCQRSISEEKYNVLPILELINRYFISLKKECHWGYSLHYMISGVYEAHPNYAMNLSENDYSIEDTRLALKIINQMDLVGFDKDIIQRISDTGFIGDAEKFSSEEVKNNPNKQERINKPTYHNKHIGRNFLLLSNGPSVVEYKKEIDQFIKQFNPVVIGTNSLKGLFTPDYHVFNNESLLEKHINEVVSSSTLLIPNHFHERIKETNDVNFEYIQVSDLPDHQFDIKDGIINKNFEAVSLLSISVAIAMGASQIYVAGMDGYKDFETFYELAFDLGDFDSDKKQNNKKLDISNRSGTFIEQMLWHNKVDKGLKQINDYLVSKKLNDILIITPTSHKLYYLGINNCLQSNRKL